MTFVNDHWVNQLDPKLIHLWGEIGVSYYGLAYVIGFVCGVFMPLIRAGYVCPGTCGPVRQKHQKPCPHLTR